MLITVLKSFLSLLLIYDISLNYFLSSILSSYLFLVGSSNFSFSHLFCVTLLAQVFFSAYCSSRTKLMPEAQKSKREWKCTPGKKKKKTSIIPKSYLTTSSRIVFNTRVWENIKQDCAVLVGPPLLRVSICIICIFMLYLQKGNQ